uniref:EGF-like domain-containing protein n=1 Tax=Oncorhynchus tshawytscha TaxID=74940 RepID=A0AAZ3QM89_ONCTS
MSPGVCICPPGYYGDSCDKANCSITCLNGGTCFHPGKCICHAGYEGPSCGISKCLQPCRNGGKCTGKNKCKCDKGFHGDLCSKGYRGGASNTHRLSSGPKHKPQQHSSSAKEVKDAPDAGIPAETNYVV